MQTCHSTLSTINLERVANDLDLLQMRFSEANKYLKEVRPAFTDEVKQNLLLGYAYIDHCLQTDINLLDYGNSNAVLELNALVLSGDSTRRRARNETHLEATKRWVHKKRKGDLESVVTWGMTHQHLSPWKQAAGIFIRVLRQPQLFIEGNHRTGSLLMSYILMRHGLPPFVLSPKTVKAFFDPCTMTRELPNTVYSDMYRIPKLKKQFARLLKNETNESYLIAGT